MADSRDRQTHLPDATSLHPGTVPQRGTGVRAPDSRSGGHEFESPVRQELGALTKSGKTLGVRSFYSIIVLALVLNYSVLLLFNLMERRVEAARYPVQTLAVIYKIYFWRVWRGAVCLDNVDVRMGDSVGLPEGHYLLTAS
jgi:hypothetical protein